jgi:hypothetical protein
MSSMSASAISIVSATGYYTGDVTDNRAIAHTLQRVPNMVKIAVVAQATGSEGVILARSDIGTTFMSSSSRLGAGLPVTSPNNPTLTNMNSANFYVGLAVVGYEASCNVVGVAV